MPKKQKTKRKTKTKTKKGKGIIKHKTANNRNNSFSVNKQRKSLAQYLMGQRAIFQEPHPNNSKSRFHLLELASLSKDKIDKYRKMVIKRETNGHNLLEKLQHEGTKGAVPLPMIPYMNKHDKEPSVTFAPGTKKRKKKSGKANNN